MRQYVRASVYGPYDKLLNYCFSDGFSFYVAPQNSPRDGSRNAVGFIIFLVMFDSHDTPVLIIQVKDSGWVGEAELRYRADKQLQDQ